MLISIVSSSRLKTFHLGDQDGEHELPGRRAVHLLAVEGVGP